MIRFTSAVVLALFFLATSWSVVDALCPCWTSTEIDALTLNAECEFYNENDSGQQQQGEGPGWRYGYLIAEDENGAHLDCESFVDPVHPYCVKITEDEFLWLDSITYAESLACLADVTSHCAQLGLP